MQDFTQKPEPKLLDQVRGKIRLKYYSIRTEQAYVDWIKRFICHFGKRHPRELGAVEVEQFLTHLAVQGKVAASTQNQAKSALLFAIRLPRICWKAATISAPFRSCWDILMSVRP